VHVTDRSHRSDPKGNDTDAKEGENDLPLGSVAPSSHLSVKKYIEKVEKQLVATS